MKREEGARIEVESGDEPGCQQNGPGVASAASDSRPRARQIRRQAAMPGLRPAPDRCSPFAVCAVSGPWPQGQR